MCNLHTFSPRLFVRPGLWRIPEPGDPAGWIDWYKRGLYCRGAIIERIRHVDLHFPSAPYRAAKYTIRVDRDGGLSINGFCTLVMAKAWVDAVLTASGDKPRWSGATRLETDALTIECPQLEDIMECEGKVELPYPYTAMASQAAGGPYLTFHPRSETIAPQEEPQRRSARARGDKAERPKRPRPEGGTTAADLGAELGMEPSLVRRILRGAGVEKPYAWEGDELQRVRGILEKGKKR